MQTVQDKTNNMLSCLRGVVLRRGQIAEHWLEERVLSGKDNDPHHKMDGVHNRFELKHALALPCFQYGS